MAEFKKWISYLYAYRGEEKGNNVGFARVEIRDGRCRLHVRIKGICGCEKAELDLGMYILRQNEPEKVKIGTMKIREGCGEYEAVTDAADLFQKGVSWQQWTGLWMTCLDQDTVYQASWEKSQVDTREVLANEIKEPSFWESLTRYYPRIHPQWQRRGVEMLQIRAADIRYLPRRLWYYGNNSFLLHGYYQYKHLMLGRITDEENGYLLGVPGRQEPRECYFAKMFGFHHFLPVQEQEGYWYTKIHL